MVASAAATVVVAVETAALAAAAVVETAAVASVIAAADLPNAPGKTRLAPQARPRRAFFHRGMTVR